jgi:ubiquinone/menaquinone biosynthesis C-methylase UbiE
MAPDCGEAAMKLNFFERAFIDSPLRRLLQRHFEARRLLRLGGPMKGGIALEVGCGPGGGIELIRNLFGADAVEAFDLDAAMIRRTRERLPEELSPPALWTGNVRAIPARDNRYDAVFNFGAIHHVVNWRSAISEIYRVLKPGGRFYCEEILGRWITHPVWGRLMEHPQIDRFDTSGLIGALTKCGFTVKTHQQLADLYLWAIADKVG